MAYVAKDFARSTIAGALTSGSTSLTVQTGHGDRFPVIAAPDHTVLVLKDGSGNFEKVKAEIRASGADTISTLTRGYDGTTARSWASGSIVELCPDATKLAQAVNDRAQHEAAADPHPQYAEKVAPARMFYPHTAATPNMTVLVDAGTLTASGALAQQVTGAITAPGTNARIDRVVIDAVTGTISVVAGTVAASPVAPAIPAGKLPCCQVGPILPSTTAITDSMITDERTPWGTVRPDNVIAQDFTIATTTGTAPDLTFDSKLGAGVAYGARQRHRITFHAAGAGTLARDGLTAVALKQRDGSGAKVAFTSVAGVTHDVEHDGTHYVVLDPLPLAATSSPYKNKIINGDMRIDQRNGGSAITPVPGQQFGPDRFSLVVSQNAKITGQQVTDAPAGFKYSFKISVNSQYSPAAADYFFIRHAVEGQEIVDLGFGTAAPTQITISLYVKASVAGTYAISLLNNLSGTGRCYVGTVSATTSWAKQTITLTADNSGTWASDNTAGLYIQIDLGSGSNYNTATTGNFQATSGQYYSRTSGCVTLVNQTAGASLNITGVRLESGSGSDEILPYETELRRCQRYFWTGTHSLAAHTASGPGIVHGAPICFPVTMRATPTLTNTGGVATNASAGSFDNPSVNGGLFSITSAGSGQFSTLGRVLTASSEL